MSLKICVCGEEYVSSRYQSHGPLPSSCCKNISRYDSQHILCLDDWEEIIRNPNNRAELIKLNTKWLTLPRIKMIMEDFDMDFEHSPNSDFSNIRKFIQDKCEIVARYLVLDDRPDNLTNDTLDLFGIDPIIIKPKIDIIYNKKKDCPICWAGLSFLTTNCGHTVCWSCMTRIIDTNMRKDIPCPMCRTVITKLLSTDQWIGESLEEMVEPFTPQAS